MRYRMRAATLLVLSLLASAWGAASAAEDVDALARDVTRLESLREVKDLQRSYAHLAQLGQWNDMAKLFTTDGRFIRGTEVAAGRAAIAVLLTRRGSGRQGIAPGALHLEMIDEPLANLSADGQSARVRWMSMSFLGDGQGRGSIEGGIYENEYRLEEGRWRISLAHFHPQYSGPYETGWTNEGGADLPLVPFHFTLDETGIPIPPATGPAPRSAENLAALMQRIERMNDEDAVRNLQHAYGYYVDRKMWDDVVDLFAARPEYEIVGGERYRGAAGVRRALERMGSAGLRQGELNDRPQYDTLVQVMPGGREAIARGFEMAMLGEADKGTAHWEVTVFHNRFVKENGVWKLKQMRLYPQMRAAYDKGWGDGGMVKAVKAPLLGARPKYRPARQEGATLSEARRKLARSMAYEGTVNVSAAYGYYVDDFQWPQMGGLFANKGNKHSPFAGYYIGSERITKAATSMYGGPPPLRAGISFHWRIQPVVLVAEDGRSANLRTRLFQPRTTKTAAQDGSLNGPSLYSGMYPNDQTVLENGIWRLWSLEIDEPYFTMAGWKGGWINVKPAPPGAPRPPLSPLVARFAPDILMSVMGRRAEGFRGGTGETIEWPGILPMWFNYRNPVTGRVPERYWPDCVPCELRPESSMTKHGYLMPPTGP